MEKVVGSAWNFPGMEEELKKDMDAVTPKEGEAGYGEYARVQIVTDNTLTSPGDWYIAQPKLEGGAITTGTGTVTTGTFKMHTITPDQKDLQDVSDMAQLLSEAGQSSLHDLCNLWQARWGTNWVKRGEIDGEFWEVAAARLHAAARLEAHVLADGTRVFKLDNE